ncbi:MAG: hypothetical protein ACO1O1_04700 [Adhaeribacter sp.]
MKQRKYKQLWLSLVNFKSEAGKNFKDLIDLDDQEIKDQKYIGAWANILVKADAINQAIEIIGLGLQELNFEVIFIDKIENIDALVEKKELNDDVMDEANWLLESDFVFKISDRIFPYTHPKSSP